MRTPNGVRAESTRTPNASRAGALHIHSHIHIQGASVIHSCTSPAAAHSLWTTPPSSRPSTAPEWMEETPMIRPAGVGERTPWTCEVCGTVGPWGPDWRHYGSIKFDEECGHMVITCSNACRDTDRAAALILAYEQTHRYTCKAGAPCR